MPIFRGKLSSGGSDADLSHRRWEDRLKGGHNRRKVRVRAALLRPAQTGDTAKRASAELYAAAVRTTKNL